MKQNEFPRLSLMTSVLLLLFAAVAATTAGAAGAAAGADAAGAGFHTAADALDAGDAAAAARAGRRLLDFAPANTDNKSNDNDDGTPNGNYVVASRHGGLHQVRI